MTWPAPKLGASVLSASPALAAKLVEVLLDLGVIKTLQAQLVGQYFVFPLRVAI